MAALAGLTGCTRETVTSETVGPRAALGVGTVPGGQPSPGDIDPVTGIRAGVNAGSSH